MSMPRWQRRKDDRPGEIIDAAIEMFVAKGFTATRLDDVAKQAGVTKGTVYLYFSNKEDLFKAVVKEIVVGDLETAEQQAKDWEGSHTELLRQLMLTWAELLSSPRTSGIIKLIIGEASNFPELAQFYVHDVAERGRKLFAYVIERGIAAGEFRPVDIDIMSREVIAPLVMVAVWKRCFGAFEPHELDIVKYTELHFDVMVNGIAQRTS
ncbi:TetR/AcrR family transcriptional regulator [Burkholderiaceae bacterium DAT-1]|nr:TetR/AcrR family transcriptional regulator [Burkholderiaceae bacterium DAT-1]